MANTLASNNNWYNSCIWEREEVEFQTYYENAILDYLPTVFHSEDEEKYNALFDTVFNAYLNPIPGNINVALITYPTSAFCSKSLSELLRLNLEIGIIMLITVQIII
jgi:hypothetical protein